MRAKVTLHGLKPLDGGSLDRITKLETGHEENKGRIDGRVRDHFSNTEAIQELAGIIKTMKDEIDNLRARIVAIEQKKTLWQRIIDRIRQILGIDPLPDH